MRNPNWFNANFERITAEVKYKDGQFGGGTIYNANFKAYTASDFIFPFYLK